MRASESSLPLCHRSAGSTVSPPLLPPSLRPPFIPSLPPRLCTTTKARNHTNTGTRTCRGRQLSSLSQQSARICGLLRSSSRGRRRAGGAALRRGRPGGAVGRAGAAGLRRSAAVSRGGTECCSYFCFPAAQVMSGEAEAGIGILINFIFFCIL